jgi:hypothetical protein
LPVDVLDLPELRSRAAILQHRVSRLGATPAASSGQSAASGERRGKRAEKGGASGSDVVYNGECAIACIGAEHAARVHQEP